MTSHANLSDPTQPPVVCLLPRPFHEPADILETVGGWDATRADGAVSEVAMASPTSTSEPTGTMLLDGSGAAECALATAIAAKVSWLLKGMGCFWGRGLHRPCAATDVSLDSAGSFHVTGQDARWPICAAC